MTPPTSCGGASSSSRPATSWAATAAWWPSRRTGGPPDPRPTPGYAELAGKTAKQAQARIVELLAESGRARGRAEADHPPGEVLRDGLAPARDRDLAPVVLPQRRSRPELREAFLARGQELHWHPPHMRQRYESWVEGLNTDWLISRQRFFGVPFPVWYRLGADGEVDYDAPLLPTEDQLPVDPSSDVPDGFTADQRGEARRVHRRPRRDGHLGDVVAHAPDRHRLGRRRRPLRPHVPDGPAPAGPRDHPHLALRHHRARALRARVVAVDRHDDQRLDPRPRPQEDVEEQGQRRHADAAARAARRRRGAVLGRERASGHGHRDRTRAR